MTAPIRQESRALPSTPAVASLFSHTLLMGGSYLQGVLSSGIPLQPPSPGRQAGARLSTPPSRWGQGNTGPLSGFPELCTVSG